MSCVLIIWLSYVLYRKLYLTPRIGEIRANMKITEGLITYVSFENYRGRSGIIKYEYTVRGKNIVIETPLHNPDKFTRNDLIYKHFPVVFSSLHNDISDILIEKEDSLKYDIK